MSRATKTDKELATKARQWQDLALNRLLDRSQKLNLVLYRVAVALGLVSVPGEDYEGDINDLLDRLTQRLHRVNWVEDQIISLVTSGEGVSHDELMILAQTILDGQDPTP